MSEQKNKEEIFLMCPTEEEVKNLFGSTPKNCCVCKVLVFAKKDNLTCNPHIICQRCWQKRSEDIPKDQQRVLTDAEWKKEILGKTIDSESPTKNSLSDDQVTEGYVVCGRTCDGPHNPTITCRKQYCSSCGEYVWLSQSIWSLVDAKKVLPICNECAIEKTKEDPEIFSEVLITDKQRAELKKKGLTDNMIDEALNKLKTGKITLEQIDKLNKLRGRKN